jgi:hypothetical protein
MKGAVNDEPTYVCSCCTRSGRDAVNPTAGRGPDACATWKVTRCPVLLNGGLAPYLGAGVIFATGTGTFVGGGVTLGLTPQWNGYVGVNVRSVGGTSTTAFDVGAQFVFTSLVSGVIGVAGTDGTGGASNLYLGVTFSY